MRTEESTRGHLLVTMLSHMIVRELRSRWSHLNRTVGEGLQELSLISRQTVTSGGISAEFISKPNEKTAVLLDALGIKIPSKLNEIKNRVVTTHKVRETANF